MTEYVVVLEPASDGSWSAYVPDLPGVAAAASDRESAKREIKSAIELHLEELRRHGDPAPKPGNATAVVAV